MDRNTPSSLSITKLPKLAQTHVHGVSDAIQPSHPLLFPSPPTFNLSQHQGLFQWVSSSHQVAKILGVSNSAKKFKKGKCNNRTKENKIYENTTKMEIDFKMEVSSTSFSPVPVLASLLMWFQLFCHPDICQNIVFAKGLFSFSVLLQVYYLLYIFLVLQLDLQ